MEKDHKPIFLSHSTENEDIMLNIAAYLEAHGYPTWYAQKHILPSENYQTKIIDALEEVDIVMVLVTKEVEKSEFVPKEIDRAITYNKIIIPLRVDGSPIPRNLNLFLCNIQWFDLLKYATLQEALDALMLMVEEILQGNRLQAWNPENANALKKPIILSQSTGTTSTLYKVHPNILNKTEKVFVPPANYESIKTDLAKKNFSLLFHPQHTGKYTAAVRLLQEMDVTEIYEWSKESSFHELISQSGRKQTGFIAWADAEDFFAYLTDSAFEAYLQKLQENDCYVIILSEQKHDEGYIAERTWMIEPSSEKEKLILKHLSYINQWDEVPDHILEWIHSPEVQKMLPEKMVPQEAENLAKKMAAAVHGDLNESFILESLTERIAARVKDWFKEERTIEDIAFYLTLAVFQGDSYPSILKRAKELTELFRSELQHYQLPGSTIEARDEYLSIFHARAYSQLKNTDVGNSIATEPVFLQVQEDAFFIWEYAWKQYPHFQKPLKTWIYSLLKEKKGAGTVYQMAAHLLKKDFLSARMELLQPLANSNHIQERLHAVEILEEYAKSEDHSFHAYKLAKVWANLGNNQRLQWTSTVLLGGKIGAQFFPESLQLLKTIYQSSENNSFSVNKSLQRLGEVACWDPQLEKVYFIFWAKWLQSEQGENLAMLLDSAQKTFFASPAIFFDTNERYIQLFWTDLLLSSYQKSISRKTIGTMLDRFITSSVNNHKRITRVASLLRAAYERADHETRDRLEQFLIKKMKNNKQAYLPVCTLVLREENSI